ncbi:universal stress protein UspE [Celerinatantimonas yamalensis]|uniref:Universal stress protein UspE n=1 Tax=Celerinatantimonas yamalensis TaxID=559956 RepID=A0ABW9G312_9GAMM
MIQYQNILVVIDPTQDEQAALSRAIFLSQQKQNAPIKALLTIYDFSYEMTSMLSSDEREAMRSAVIADRIDWLNKLVAHYQHEGVVIETKVLWNNRLYEAIINEAIEFKHDLIVKSTHSHPKLKSVIFTPTDWHLLRKTPCPLLLVKNNDWSSHGRILAAVHLGAEDELHLRLNEQITSYSRDLAQLVDGELHVINAYPPAPANIAIELPDFDPELYNRSVKEQHEELVKDYISQYQLSAEQVHLEEGLPDDAIIDTAYNLDVGVVVLGTCGRSGLSGALIGNTAEHVIDQLNCDLLALRPESLSKP